MFGATQSNVADGLIAMLKDPKAAIKQLETVKAATKEHDEALARHQEAIKVLSEKEEELKDKVAKLSGISAGLDARSEAIARREDEAVANMRQAAALKDEFEKKTLALSSGEESIALRLKAIDTTVKELLDKEAELMRRDMRLKAKEAELADTANKLERKLAAFDAAVNA